LPTTPGRKGIRLQKKREKTAPHVSRRIVKRSEGKSKGPHWGEGRALPRLGISLEEEAGDSKKNTTAHDEMKKGTGERLSSKKKGGKEIYIMRKSPFPLGGGEGAAGRKGRKGGNVGKTDDIESGGLREGNLHFSLSAFAHKKNHSPPERGVDFIEKVLTTEKSQCTIPHGPSESFRRCYEKIGRRERNIRLFLIIGAKEEGSIFPPSGIKKRPKEGGGGKRVIFTKEGEPLLSGDFSQRRKGKVYWPLTRRAERFHGGGESLSFIPNYRKEM